MSKFGSTKNFFQLKSIEIWEIQVEVNASQTKYLKNQTNLLKIFESLLSTHEIIKFFKFWAAFYMIENQSVDNYKIFNSQTIFICEISLHFRVSHLDVVVFPFLFWFNVKWKPTKLCNYVIFVLHFIYNKMYLFNLERCF